MGDDFKIGLIENFNCEIEGTEISDISKIIKEMINIKSSKIDLVCKKSRTYDIAEKINLNNFTSTPAEKIKKYHIDACDVIEDAINCLEELEAFISADLYDYYWEVYTNILISLKINIHDEEKIKENVDDIYSGIIDKIYKELFLRKKTDIPLNKIITYISAITAYVFYKCKFLIPVEKCKY
ncbi:MAG: hypothetical protein ACI8WT_004282 [Clostridium sp.]|jgi:hypothetical protein